MNDLSMSEMSAHSKVDAAGNQLVIVVIKAQDLPNRRKLDKQSPYVVARIQDQTQRTRVVPRGGQTPIFNQELWFSLENIESTTVNLMIYHQQKKDSELVCQADIDFSIALRRSTNEGYDSWFDLEYKDRPAGRIYLEMTYYPSSDSVPVSVGNNLTDVSKSFSDTVPALAARARMSKNAQFRASIMPTHDETLPALPDLDDLEDDVSELNIPVGSTTSNKSWKKDCNDKDAVARKQDTNKGWLAKLLENASNKTLPYIFGSPPKAKPEEKKKSNKMSFQRQLSSPSLIGDDIPGQLFVDSSDEEDEGGDDDDLAGRIRVKPNNAWIPDGFSSGRASINDTKDGSMTKTTELHDDSDSDCDEFDVGQKVEFRASNRFTPLKRAAKSEPLGESQRTSLQFRPECLDRERRISSLRQSFKIKPLPAIKNLDAGGEIPPPPPKHLIPTDLENLFSTSSETRDENSTGKAPSVQPRKVSIRTPPFLLHDFGQNRISSNDCKRKTLSYSEIRRLKFLGMIND